MWAPWRRDRPLAGASSVRLFFATDLHGSDICFQKFLSAAKAYGVDLLILGGDLTGKGIVPLTRNASGLEVRTAEGMRPLGGPDEVAAYRKSVANAGLYCVEVDTAAAERLTQDDAAVSRALVTEATKRAREWLTIAVRRLDGTGVRCFVTGGNDDPPEVLNVFANADDPHIIFCDERVVPLADDIELVSVGHGNPTPWKTYREVPENTLRKLIDSVVSSARNPKRSIFNLHVPPLGSCLDICPKLDETTDPPTPIRVGGAVLVDHAGSSAVKEAIEQYQPLLSLHGHIHESRGLERIGSTLAINPGSEYGDGVLRGAIVAITGGRITHQFTSG